MGLTRCLLGGLLAAGVLGAPIRPAAASPAAAVLAQAEPGERRAGEKPRRSPRAPARPEQRAEPAQRPPPAASPTAAPAVPPTPLAGLAPPGSEPQPVLHARNAGMGSACLDAVGRAVAGTVEPSHVAVSTWFTGAADQHLFESIVASTGADRLAVQGATVVTVGPTRGGEACESTSVQVYPSRRTCEAIRGDLMNGGQLLAELAGAPLVRSAAGFRNLLLPTAGNGCVIVSVGLSRGR